MDTSTLDSRPIAELISLAQEPLDATQIAQEAPAASAGSR